MTPPQVNLQEEINALAEGHRIIDKAKLNNRLSSIERMTAFYESKLPDAYPGQAAVFKRFIIALVYAGNVIRMYHNLTKKLAQLSDNDRM